MITTTKQKLPFALLIVTLINTAVFAQDTTYSSSSNVVSEQLWYMQPWVWVVGGVVLLLLLIALFGGRKKASNNVRTDKVIITKTVRTESDVNDQ